MEKRTPINPPCPASWEESEWAAMLEWWNAPEEPSKETLLHECTSEIARADWQEWRHTGLSCAFVCHNGRWNCDFGGRLAVSFGENSGGWVVKISDRDDFWARKYFQDQDEAAHFLLTMPVVITMDWLISVGFEF